MSSRTYLIATLAPGACVRGASAHSFSITSSSWTASGLCDRVRFTGLGLSGEGNFGTLPCFKLVVEIQGVALVDKEVGDGVASQLAYERDEVTTNAARGTQEWVWISPPNAGLTH
jgi:hypothetical protein